MRLGKASSAEIGAKNMETDPLRLHLLITSSYVDNWRLYLHDMTRQFLELVRKSHFVISFLIEN